MLKDYLHKIKVVLEDSETIIPHHFQTFYTVINLCTQNIPSSAITPQIIEHMSGIYKFYKNNLKPNHKELPSDKIHSELSDMLLHFNKYGVHDEILKLAKNHFDDISFITKLQKERQTADKMIQSYRQKGNKIHVKSTNEVAYCIWINNFKADYAVHFDIVWNVFLKQMETESYYGNFINQSSKQKIRKVLDSDRKYYITSANLSDLLRRMNEPQFLTELAQQASLKNKPNNFKSNYYLQMKFIQNIGSNQSSNLGLMCDSYQTVKNERVNSSFPIQQIILVSGQNLKCAIQNKDNIQHYGKTTINIQNKYPPTIRFGSLSDNQFCLKAPYISRRQFMIIEQEYIEELGKSEQNQTKSIDPKFSLVCLSPSNYTAITYDRRVQITEGLIFRVDSQIIEITKISEQFSGIKHEQQSLQLFVSNNQEYQPTLSYLPHQKSVNTLISLTYMFLNGKNKNIKGTCNCLKNQIMLSSGIPFQLSYSEQKFYLPNQTQILVKNSNQIISGHMSHKIGLQSSMKICLEGFKFEILSIRRKNQL